MGKCYKVTKRIHGRYYDYWQRTERHGRSVKTFNKYIGPSGNTVRLAGLVVSNKATNLKIIERDGVSALGHPTGKKVYHLEGNVPPVHPGFTPPPAVMEFQTLREARNVLNTTNRLSPPSLDSTAMRKRNALERRVLEAEAEDEHFYQHYATPEQRKEMEKARPSLKLHSAATSNGPTRPEDAIWALNPTHNPDNVDLRKYKRHRQEEIWDNESVQWGSVKSRKKRQDAAVRKAKRETRGVTALNPFLAQAMTRAKKTSKK